jgi:hypothetical protein
MMNMIELVEREEHLDLKSSFIRPARIAVHPRLQMLAVWARSAGLVDIYKDFPFVLSHTLQVPVCKETYLKSMTFADCNDSWLVIANGFGGVPVMNVDADPDHCEAPVCMVAPPSDVHDSYNVASKGNLLVVLGFEYDDIDEGYTQVFSLECNHDGTDTHKTWTLLHTVCVYLESPQGYPSWPDSAFFSPDASKIFVVGDTKKVKAVRVTDGDVEDVLVEPAVAAKDGKACGQELFGNGWLIDDHQGFCAAVPLPFGNGWLIDEHLGFCAAVPLPSLTSPPFQRAYIAGPFSLVPGVGYAVPHTFVDPKTYLHSSRISFFATADMVAIDSMSRERVQWMAVVFRSTKIMTYFS